MSRDLSTTPWLCVIVVIATLFCYSDLLWTTRVFTNFDDPVNFVRNHRVKEWSWTNVRWAFEDGVTVGVYEPISTLVKLVFIGVYDGGATEIVRLNLCLHLVNVVLCVYLLAETTMWWNEFVATSSRRGTDSTYRASFAVLIGALVFAIHPLRVEVVAWPSCMPHMLADTFAMMCVLLHLRRRLRSTTSTTGTHAVTCALYALAVFSKTSAITTPIVVFAIDMLSVSLRRTRDETSVDTTSPQGRVVVLEAIPYVVVSVLAFYCANVAKRQDYKQKGSIFDHLSPLVVVSYTSIALVWHLKQTMWPMHLTIWYPIPQWVVIANVSDILNDARHGGLVGVSFVAPAVVLLAIVWATFKATRTPLDFNRWLLLICAVLTYVVLVLPTIGVLTQHSSALAADRYSYLPAAFVISPAISLVLSRSLPIATSTTRVCRMATMCLVVFCSVVLVCLSRQLVEDWSSSVTLWSRAARLVPNDATPHAMLGSAYREDGQLSDARRTLRKSLELNPNIATTRMSLGHVYYEQHHFDAAAREFLAASVRRESLKESAMMNAATAMRMATRYDEAINTYDALLSVNPHNDMIRQERSRALAESINFNAQRKRKEL